MSAVGILLLLAAGLTSSESIERALLGEATGSLTWGPALFRALLALHGLILVVAGATRIRRRTPRDQALHTQRLSEPTLKRTPAWAWAVLTLLTVVAGALRLYRLDSCLWFDEIDTLVNIVREPLPKIVTMFSSQNQHMFFSVLAHGSILTFGESEAALRLPSALFGLASLWALFLLGRKTLGVRESLLACGVTCFSYHHVWFSQNARGYMGLLFFTLLATWLWTEGRSRRGAGWWVAYALAVALGAWTHMTMVFVAIAHAMLYVIADVLRSNRASATRSTELRLRPLLAWPVSATLTLQLYALGLPEFLRSALHEVSQPSEWTNPLWVVQETLRNLSQGGPIGGAVMACGGLLLALGWLRLYARDGAFAFAMILPGFLAGGTMLALGHNLWPRFFFFCIGFAVLLAIAGAMQAPRLLPSRALTRRGRDRLGWTLSILMMAAAASMLPRNYAFPKQDFIAARDFVETEREVDDVVVGVGLAGVAYERLYATQWKVAQTADELRDTLADHPRLWLVYTLPIEVRAYHPGMWEVIHAEFSKIKTFPGTLGDGAVTVCRSGP